jgi:TRAP-type C4-dicarboxylate transport system permease small subunit
MKKLENIAAALFGLSFLTLALAVTVETIMRKVFNRSLQGVDELGGYILAAGAGLSIAAALVSRAHIRIDLLHDFASKPFRIMLNITAALAIAASAFALARMSWIALDESHLFQSTAQTPWATPLWIPQTVWFGTLCIVCIVALGQLGRMGLMALQGRWAELDRNYSPRGARDELADELEDLRQRSQSNPAEGALR